MTTLQRYRRPQTYRTFGYIEVSNVKRRKRRSYVHDEVQWEERFESSLGLTRRVRWVTRFVFSSARVTGRGGLPEGPAGGPA